MLMGMDYLSLVVRFKRCVEGHHSLEHFWRLRQKKHTVNTYFYYNMLLLNAFVSTGGASQAHFYFSGLLLNHCVMKRKDVPLHPPVSSVDQFVFGTSAGFVHGV